MEDILKNTAKFAIGTCVALGAVTVATSVVVGKNIGKVVCAGYRGAKAAIKEELSARKFDEVSEEEVSMEEESVSEDFEN